ncbi:MAG: hypothetical protein ACI8UO_006181 [Verrucomicrobiales bacterium]|jgi:hypothetical protein
MAVTLSANYSKKLGLPGYSSHAFSASVEIEISDLNQVATETARLYGLLQASFDHQIQQTGYLPTANGARPESNGNGNGAGRNGSSRNGSHPSSPKWQCTLKQRELIQSIIRESDLDDERAEEISQQLLGKQLAALSKSEASQLIDELFAQPGVRRR